MVDVDIEIGCNKVKLKRTDAYRSTGATAKVFCFYCCQQVHDIACTTLPRCEQRILVQNIAMYYNSHHNSSIKRNAALCLVLDLRVRGRGLFLRNNAEEGNVYYDINQECNRFKVDKFWPITKGKFEEMGLWLMNKVASEESGWSLMFEEDKAKQPTQKKHFERPLDVSYPVEANLVEVSDEDGDDDEGSDDDEPPRKKRKTLLLDGKKAPSTLPPAQNWCVIQ